MINVIYIVIGVIILIICLIGISDIIVKDILNKFDQAQFSFIDNLKTYEGKLLICGYADETLPAQEIFDTSQLEEKGLMAIIYVNGGIKEPVLYENAMVMCDEEGICSVIVL